MLCLDHIRCFFSNSIKSGSQMTADLKGYYGRIDNADVACSVYSEGGVNDSTELLRHHRSSADVVEVGAV
jgi:hypothetical protein